MIPPETHMTTVILEPFEMTYKRRMITWTFDPFSQTPHAIRESARTLAALGRASRQAVEPLYVVSPAEMKIAYATGSIVPRKMCEYAMEKCRSSLGGAATKGLLSPQVIYETSTGLSASAVAAAKRAKRRHADFLYVSTRSHGHTGLRGLGSFTNALMAAAEVPLVSVRPQTKLSVPRRILFATDFSAPSARALKRLLPTAKRLGAKLVITHVFSDPIYPIYEDPLVLTTPYPLLLSEKDLQKAIEEQRQRAQKLARLAQKGGVATEVVIQRGKNGIAATILAAARKHRADWIALAGESDRFGRYFLGTTAQALVHNSPIPVWTYKSK